MLWAQSTTEDYIRAKNKLQFISQFISLNKLQNVPHKKLNNSLKNTEEIKNHFQNHIPKEWIQRSLFKIFINNNNNQMIMQWSTAMCYKSEKDPDDGHIFIPIIQPTNQSNLMTEVTCANHHLNIILHNRPKTNLLPQLILIRRGNDRHDNKSR